MSANNLYDVIRRTGTEQGDQASQAETCIIATTANDTADDVQVTLPHTAQPNTRRKVTWRLQVDWDDGELVPRWPTRGQRAIVIELDTGELWLIY